MKKNYELLEILAPGQSRVVCKAKRKLDNLPCVIKAISMPQLDRLAQEDSENEVKKISSTEYPYIVKYYDSFLEDNILYIVMEFFEKGDLSSLINSRSEPIPETQIWKIFLQICMGLEYLHHINKLHKSLKETNLFLLDDKNIK